MHLLTPIITTLFALPILAQQYQPECKEVFLHKARGVGGTSCDIHNSPAYHGDTYWCGTPSVNQLTIVRKQSQFSFRANTIIPKPGVVIEVNCGDTSTLTKSWFIHCNAGDKWFVYFPECKTAPINFIRLVEEGQAGCSGTGCEEGRRAAVRGG